MAPARNTRRRVLTFLRRAAITLVVMALGYGALLRWPGALFPHDHTEHNLTLYSDRPFESGQAAALLAQVQERLAASPLYDPTRAYGIVICNAPWRHRLFMGMVPEAGGLFFTGIPNAFLCGGDVGANRLIRHGSPVTGERGLDYFIAHELAHAITAETIGWWAFHRLPEWKREGYADYVGRGSVLRRPGARQAFLEEAPEMNTPAIAPYLRYNLLVGFLLEERGLSTTELFARGFSAQSEAEAIARQAFMADVSVAPMP